MEPNTRNSKTEKENSLEKLKFHHSPKVQTYEQVERTYSTTIKKSDAMGSYSPRALVNKLNRTGL